jgi:hypothetical protein
MVNGDYTEYWTDRLGTAAQITAMNRNSKRKMKYQLAEEAHQHKKIC